MKRTVLWALGILAALAASVVPAADEITRVERGNLVIEGIPEIPERIQQGLRRYQNTRSANFLGWEAHSGTVLISTRFGETEQIHRVAGPRYFRRQLTYFDEPVRFATPSPDPTVPGFLFTRDVGGSEYYQIFFYDAKDGTSRMLTDGSSRNSGPVWARSGRRFAWASTLRNGRDYDLYVASIDDPVPQRVLEAEGAWSVRDWSPDGAWLLVSQYVSLNESRLFRLRLADGERLAIDPSDAPVSYRQARFARDGAGVWFLSDRDSEFQRLRYLDFATGEVRIVTADIPWDVEAFALDPLGPLLAFTVNEDGFSKLHALDLSDDSALTMPAMPPGRISGLAFNPKGGRVAFTLSGAQGTGNVYSVRPARSRLVRWTNSELGGLDPAHLAPAELIRFATFDKVDGVPRTLPSFYYRPAGDGPFPVLIDIHGGPESQERPTFNPLIQYVVGEMGVAVLAPNVRGSAGYGKSALLLDNGARREDTVRDIGALLDWIAARPELDADRVAVIGGSYGGYMVLASMAAYNDRLRAGIDIVGISNFVTFLENTKPYRRDLRRAEYGDERDPEMRSLLTRISPTTNAAKIRQPLLIAQGLNDPRVPASESEQMVAEIRANGGLVWYLLANDEGHGFRKKRNRDFYTAAVALFLETHLLAKD